MSVAVCAALLLQACAGNEAKTSDVAAGVEACATSSGRHEGDKTIALCNTVLTMNGLTAELQARALAARGSAYNEKADYPRAIADFDKVISLQPSVFAYASRGYAYAMNGDFPASIRDLDRAIQMRPAAELHANRAWSYMMQGDLTSALSDFSKAAELNPKLTNIYENRSTLYFIRGEYDLAAADVEKAVELDPGNPFGYIWLYIDTRRDHRDASWVLQKAAQANAGWPSVLLRFIQGKATELNVHEEVRSGPLGAVSVERDCHTQLILGELALLDRWTDTAGSRFRYASTNCPFAQSERIIADAELKRM